jgi:methylenetetrahydrofolate dehydrogenase (NADP+)/methenyltetrahydrofolate cyclohydrolase
MAARVLDGKACAAQWREQAAMRLSLLAGRGVRVAVAVVRVGEEEAAVGYARSLSRALGQAGVDCVCHSLPADSPQDRVRALLAALSADPAVHGIMLQEPLPAPLEAAALTLAIDPAKDIDGVHPLNAGKLLQGRADGFVPATALGGLLLLEREQVPLAGRRAVVIGRSNIVGRPLALLLLHRHCTVTVCHSRTADLPAVARTADILAVAIGRPWLVTPEFVAPGATVLDFGTNYADGQLRGDVHPEVAEVAGALSPTPGGTGAVTTAALLHNAVTAAERL